jgi:predicted nucleic acid-binding protein
VYLVDTNIWLERLLGQDKSEIVGKFLDYVAAADLAVSDFALHSIGVILSRLHRRDAFLEFIEDLFINGSVSIVRLEAEDMPDVISVVEKFKIDFDDAYQYTAAQKFNFTVVSFDKDFDRTPSGRKTPQDIYQRKKKK